ncbi:MAG: citrate lyase holo-[acyl-carrier protein] synthase [Deltaproteobacteria bacterium]|jgi:triphosphoribosyl-dephospho-CoA synthase|nr:citrate lyase holo-[acyl-carrier protein] synthase [Deltaproteobacteria bacterium]
MAGDNTQFKANPVQAAILGARERRARRRLELVWRFETPLIQISVNVPGPDKLSGPWGNVLAEGVKAVERKLHENNLSTLHLEVGRSMAGHDAFMVVDSDSLALKRLCVAIESEHPLGRLLDIDVFDNRGAPISRRDLGARKRPCFICGEPAVLCRRSAAHDLSEVLAYMLNVAKPYFGADPTDPGPSSPDPGSSAATTDSGPPSTDPGPPATRPIDKAAPEVPSAALVGGSAAPTNLPRFLLSQPFGFINADNFSLAHDLAALAIQALIYEVSSFPAPGLVSPVSNGAHSDMNYFTFIDSASVLFKHFVYMAAIGYSDRSEEEIFSLIREAGKKAEQAMYRKTNGVNTHKGAIFVLGVCLAATAKVLHRKGAFKEIHLAIGSMARGLVAADLNLTALVKKTRPTHGELIYYHYNLPGVRAEAEAGFPIVFNLALPFYEAASDLPINDRLVHTLLEIMRHCQDTNVVYRQTPKALSKIQATATEAMALGGIRTSAGRSAINAMHDELVANNISPGGSADLLGATVFLSQAKLEYFPFQ